MTSYYYERSLSNVNKLAVNTKAAAKKLLSWAESNGIEVLIYETIRTKEQQAANVASGASQTMKSYHLVGQAMDFVMASGKTVDWSGYRSAKAKKFVAKAKSLGFEWGGDWKGFVDNPHLQFNYKGYGTDPFTGSPASGGNGNSSKPDANDSSLTLVGYMEANKMDSSYTNRAKLAKDYGIAGYKGTAAQNIKLLALLKADKPHTPKSNYYTSNPKKVKVITDSVGAYNSTTFSDKTMTGGRYKKGTVFTITGIKKDKHGTPRLVTKSGFLITANKKYVKQV